MTCAVAASAPIDGDVADVVTVLRHLSMLRCLIDAREVACLNRLDRLAEFDPGIVPEQLVATASRRNLAAAGKVMTRARAASGLPAFVSLLDAGELSGEHLDAFADGVRSLEPALRARLLERQSDLATEATAMTVSQFARRVRAEVRRIEGDDGKERLERQKRQIGLRTWTDREGMWNIAGRYDPETALQLAPLLQRQTSSLFRAAHPDHTPADPLLAHEFFQALALADLMMGRGPGVGAAEIIVTIDEHTWRHGRHDRSHVDCGRGIDVPIDVIRSLAGRARFVPVVVDRNGVVIRQGRPVPTFDELVDSLHRPVALDAGRTRRLATRDQRRALRAMYRHCAIPGCERHISMTEPHHLDDWDHGGHTDLDRLLPLCKHHHDRLHQQRWDVSMAPDRSLIIRRNGAVIMTTGPPAEQWC